MKKGLAGLQYTSGNLARKLDTKTTVVRRRRPKKKPLLNFKLLGIVTVCFIVAMAIQWRDGKIYEMRRNLEQSQQMLFRMEEQNKQTQLDLDRRVNLSEIEATATTKLGMHKPSKNQIVYLNIPKPDVTEVVKTQHETGFFASIVQGVGSIVEYLQ